jgi:hypothetical protein
MPENYSTYVSPIDRARAMAQFTGEKQRQQIVRDEMPQRQRLQQLAISGAEGEQHSNQQRMDILDTKLKETNLAGDAYELSLMDDNRLMSELGTRMPEFATAAQQENAPPEEIRKRLGGIVNRAEFLGLGKDPNKASSRGAVPADIQVYEYRKGLTPNEQKAFDKSVRGEQLTPQEAADASGLKQAAVEKAKTEASIKRRSTPGTDEYAAAELEKNKADKLERTKRADLFKLEDSLIAAKKVGDGITDLTTGFSQSIMKFFPGTKNFDFEASTQALTNKIALDTMLQLKANSPTGSTGFGQLSEKELQLLKNNVANLSTSQSEDQFRDNLNIVMRNYQRAAGLLKLEYLEDREPAATTLAGRIKQMESAGITDDETQRQVLSYEGLGGQEDKPDISGIQQGTTVYQGGKAYQFNGGNPSDPGNYSEIQ